MRGYDKYLPQYREQLKPYSPKTEEEKAGLQAVGGLPARAGEGERFPGTRGPPRRAEPAGQVTGQRQGEQGVTRVAKPGDINYITTGDENTRTARERAGDNDGRTALGRATEGYLQGRRVGNLVGGRTGGADLRAKPSLPRPRLVPRSPDHPGLRSNITPTGFDNNRYNWE